MGRYSLNRRFLFSTKWLMTYKCLYRSVSKMSLGFSRYIVMPQKLGGLFKTTLWLGLLGFKANVRVTLWQRYAYVDLFTYDPSIAIVFTRRMPSNDKLFQVSTTWANILISDKHKDFSTAYIERRLWCQDNARTIWAFYICGSYDLRYPLFFRSLVGKIRFSVLRTDFLSHGNERNLK